jgi:hypothetical protein
LRGQLQPCSGVPAEDNRVKISFGMHRLAAALLVVNGSPEDGIDAVPEFKLKILVESKNPKESFIDAVVENKMRVEVTAMDDAHNLDRLRKIGMDDAGCKEILQCSDAKLRTLEKLLLLDTDIQTAVHEGRIPVSSAVAMAEMGDADRREVLAKAVVPSNGHDESIDVGRVQEQLDGFALTPGAEVDRRSLQRSINEKKAAKGKRVSMSMADLREFLAEVANDEEANVNARGICLCFADLVNGKRRAPWMKEQLLKYVKAK